MEQSKLDFTLVNAWEALSEPAGKDAWAQGQKMSLEQAVQYSLTEA
jgi:hypothetical protein